MSDLLEKLHIDAGLDLLRADSELTVYPDGEGLVPDVPVPPYVRVYTAIETPGGAGVANALDGRSATWTTMWICHCVGANEYAAAAVAMRVRVALLDVRPVIAGRSCDLIGKESSQPTQRDSTTGIDVYDRVDVYALTTGPG